VWTKYVFPWNGETFKPYKLNSQIVEGRCENNVYLLMDNFATSDVMIKNVKHQ